MASSVVGVISDTHGLLRAEAVAALKGADVIIHAGDIGGTQVIERLSAVAPTFAVRGNNDLGPWASDFPSRRDVQVGDLVFHVLHEVAHLDLDPAASGYAAVVSGHSHRPGIQYRGGVLYLNPGSAGPRRFRLPVAIARIAVSGLTLKPEIVELQV